MTSNFQPSPDEFDDVAGHQAPAPEPIVKPDEDDVQGHRIMQFESEDAGDSVDGHRRI